MPRRGIWAPSRYSSGMRITSTCFAAIILTTAGLAGAQPRVASAEVKFDCTTQTDKLSFDIQGAGLLGTPVTIQQRGGHRWPTRTLPGRYDNGIIYTWTVDLPAPNTRDVRYFVYPVDSSRFIAASEGYATAHRDVPNCAPSSPVLAPPTDTSPGGGYGFGFRVESRGEGLLQPQWHKITVSFTPADHYVRLWLWTGNGGGPHSGPNSPLRAMAEIIDGGATLCWPLETWKAHTTPYYVGVRNEGGLPEPDTGHKEVTVSIDIQRVGGCGPTPEVAAENIELLELDQKFKNELFANVDSTETLRIPER